MIRNISILLNFFKKINNNNWYSLSIPLFIVMVLCMIILPLPTVILDLFFTFNIIFSIMILIVAMSVTKTLDFSAFPTVLLFSTLLRLSLNIASTRVILLHGHTGSFSAGRIIESFGFFLIGGNFFIGLIIFIILVVINFLVITKGSGRIAEVGARFVLDAMPGKQMAIDADLNAGIISEKEATIRRIDVHREADFYGSMDGASKFIRGDAIAGIIIMIVNIIGGLIIGIVQHNMLLLKAIKVYSILTIGDGLVAQIPSLIISIASGVILTRVDTYNVSIGEQIINQMFNSVKVIFFTGMIFSIFGLIPGMPNFIFLFFSMNLFILSWHLYNKNKINSNISKTSNLKKKKILRLSWDDVQFEPLSTLELSSIFFDSSYKDQYNHLLKHLYILRKNIAQDFGFLLPEIYVIHNHTLELGQYKILIKGVKLGDGYVFLNKLLVINSENNSINIPGIKVFEPVFNFPAFWINIDTKMDVMKENVEIVEPTTVIITHFDNIIRKNLYDLFGFQETQELLARISKNYPKLVDYLIPNIISITVLQNVLQNLLKDHISIKDIRTILENLVKDGNKFKNDVDRLTNSTRIALRKFITQKFFLNNKYVYAIGLNKDIENVLLKLIETKNSPLEPTFSEKLIKKVKLAILFQTDNNFPIVLLVHPKLRIMLSSLFAFSIPELSVLSFLEISEDRIIKIINFV